MLERERLHKLKIEAIHGLKKLPENYLVQLGYYLHLENKLWTGYDPDIVRALKQAGLLPYHRLLAHNHIPPDKQDQAFIDIESSNLLQQYAVQTAYEVSSDKLIGPHVINKYAKILQMSSSLGKPYKSSSDDRFIHARRTYNLYKNSIFVHRVPIAQELEKHGFISSEEVGIICRATNNEFGALPYFNELVVQPAAMQASQQFGMIEAFSQIQELMYIGYGKGLEEDQK